MGGRHTVTENIHDGIYSREIIINQQHFVDPLNNEVHTQKVEKMRMQFKRKLRQQFGTSEALFQSHLHDFV